MITAYVDESLRRRPSDASVYAMVGVLVAADFEAEFRSVLESLRLGRRPRLHWRDESPRHRLEIAKTLAALCVSGIAVIHLHDRQVRHERARRLCLEKLLQALGRAGATHVVIESRTTEDRLDRSLLTGLRKAGKVPRELSVTWANPLLEPLLWAADAMAGATTWWLDGQPEYFDALAESIEIICLE